LTSVEQVVVF